MKIKLIAAAAIALCAALAWWGTSQREPGIPSVTYTRLLAQVRAGEVASVSVTPQQGVAPVRARLRDGTRVRSVMPGDYRQPLALLAERGVDVEIAAAAPSLWNAAPFLLLVAVWLVLVFTLPKKKGPRNGPFKEKPTPSL